MTELMSERSILDKLVGRLKGEAATFNNEIKKNFRKIFKDQHQLTSTTAEDRYPELFGEVVRLSTNSQFVSKILSYGCSTGEECFTLKKYFPSATIIGVDINKSNLRKAEQKNSSEGIYFRFSNDENIVSGGKYQIIFCLSVLCRWEDTKFVKNCASIYPFEKFESSVEFLSNQLDVGGLLVVYNSNFRFEDTLSSKKFEIINTPSVIDSGFVKKFKSNNDELNESHVHCIYRKVVA